MIAEIRDTITLRLRHMTIIITQKQQSSSTETRPLLYLWLEERLEATFRASNVMAVGAVGAGA